MIKAVLFDYGGVLSPGGKSLEYLYEGLIGEEYVDFDSVRDLHDQLRRGIISTEDFFTKLNQRFSTNITQEEFIAKSDIFSRSEAVYNLAADLRQRGLATGIFSNVYQLSADILKKDGYYEGFSPVILSCQTGLAKPDLKFYHLAVEKLSVLPQEILFIDDQEKCLPIARELGFKVIKADSEDQIVADAKALLKAENGLEL